MLAPTNIPAGSLPLDAGLNAAVLHIAGRLWPFGWDVAEDAPDTFDKLCEHVRRRRRLTVWSGGSEDTIFGSPEVNYAFRAWHDWCHLMGPHDFSMRGEAAAAEMQCRHLADLYGDSVQTRRWQATVRAEVVGQALYRNRHGDFPERQRAFVSAYLQDPGGALSAPQFLRRVAATPPEVMSSSRLLGAWASALPIFVL